MYFNDSLSIKRLWRIEFDTINVFNSPEQQVKVINGVLLVWCFIFLVENV